MNHLSYRKLKRLYKRAQRRWLREYKSKGRGPADSTYSNELNELSAAIARKEERIRAQEAQMSRNYIESLDGMF